MPGKRTGRGGGRDRGRDGGRGGREGGRDKGSRRGQRTRAEQAPGAGETLRLQVFLSRAGMASRRGAEDLIRDGRVRVNGEVAELGSKVLAGTDRVEVDGRPVEMQRRDWVALHKPRGYVTTRDDPRDRRTVYDLLPAELHHLFHVGRLDRDSAGILLLTNDGEVANRLLHPRYGTTKEYLVDVEGRPDGRTLRQLVQGVELEDGMARAEAVEVKSSLDDELYRVRIVLREGRNREVRRMLDAVGHPVVRLFRKRFGPIEAGRLRPGQWRHLTPDEIRTLGNTDPADDLP